MSFKPGDIVVMKSQPGKDRMVVCSDSVEVDMVFNLSTCFLLEPFRVISVYVVWVTHTGAQAFLCPIVALEHAKPETES
jgi:hypothetical protein